MTRAKKAVRWMGEMLGLYLLVIDVPRWAEAWGWDSPWYVSVLLFPALAGYVWGWLLRWSEPVYTVHLHGSAAAEFLKSPEVSELRLRKKGDVHVDG